MRKPTPSGYTFQRRRHTSLEDLAHAFLDAPEAADTHLKRGYVEQWLADETRDFDAAARIAELTSREWTAPGALTLAAVTAVAPHVALRVGEVQLDEEALSSIALSALGHDERAAEAGANLLRIRSIVVDALPVLETLDPNLRSALTLWTNVHSRMAGMWTNQLVVALRQYAKEPADASRSLERFPTSSDDEVPGAPSIALAMLVALSHPMVDIVVTEVEGWFDDGPFAHTGVRDEFWALDSNRSLVGAIGALCERVAAPERAAYEHRLRGREIAASGTLGEVEAWLELRPAQGFSDHWNLLECAQTALSRTDEEVVGHRLFREAAVLPHGNKLLRAKLMWAIAQYGTPAQFEHLVALGYELGDGYDGTLQPLHAAAARSPHLELIRAMAERVGPHLDTRSEHGLTPLALAAMEQPNPTVVETLVELGAKLNTRVPEGQSRTWTLATGRQVDVAGHTILDLARMCNSNPEVAARLAALGAVATPPRTSPSPPTPALRSVRSTSANTHDGGRDLWIGIAIGSTPLLIAVFHPGWAFVGAAYIAFNAMMQASYYHRDSPLARPAWQSMAVTGGIWIVITLLWAFARFGS